MSCPYRNAALDRMKSLRFWCVRPYQKRGAMGNLSDWATTIVVVVAFAGLIWRFETRISHLGERVSRLEGLIEGLNDRVSRIETVLDSYFIQAGKREDT